MSPNITFLIIKSLGVSTNDILPDLYINNSLCENISLNYRKSNAI